MQVPAGAERFTFPNPHPTPPYTPSSSQSRHGSDASLHSPLLRKRPAFGYFPHSPPEHLQPRGDSHQFSYTPPIRDSSSESSSSNSESEDEEQEDDSEDDKDKDDADRYIANDQMSLASDSSIDALKSTNRSLKSSSIASLGRQQIISIEVEEIEETWDIVLEELSDGAIDYDTDTEVLRPDDIEYAVSDRASRRRISEHEGGLVEQLQGLHCIDHEQSQEFEAAQKARYIRKKKRWSIGRYSKRSHADSVGDDSSDNEDIEPLDDLPAGPEGRRLRRRTEGREDMLRPRTSLLFDDPPAEIEELKYLDRHRENLPPIVQSEVDEASNTSDDDDSDEDEDVDGVLEIEEDMSVPMWLYRMEIDAMGSRTPSLTSLFEPIEA